MVSQGNVLRFARAAPPPAFAPPAPGELRRDLELIAEMIEPGARILDIGCGDGALLAYLTRVKRVDARGMELSQSGVNACVSHGLSVIQGDADRDLAAYPSGLAGWRSCRSRISGSGGFACTNCGTAACR
jgi:hypothetical protein